MGQDKSRSDKFKDFAREVEADENEAAFDRALAAMRTVKPDCAVETGGGGNQQASGRAD